MIRDFILIKEVQAFLNISKSYCEFIESTVAMDSVKFLRTARGLLLKLYQSGLEFPCYEEITGLGTIDYFDSDFPEVRNQIRQNLGSKNLYIHFYSPANLADEELATGDLSDDLGDIYQELKCALINIETRSEIAKQDALWQLHFRFRSHYGEHIINGLYAIHFFVQDEPENGG